MGVQFQWEVFIDGRGVEECVYDVIELLDDDETLGQKAGVGVLEVLSCDHEHNTIRLRF